MPPRKPREDESERLYRKNHRGQDEHIVTPAAELSSPYIICYGLRHSLQWKSPVCIPSLQYSFAHFQPFCE